MKAKEIIQLYENNRKLKPEEVFELATQYFKKKFKFIGMDIIDSQLLGVQATFTVSENSDRIIQKKKSRSYLSNLIQRLPSRVIRSKASVIKTYEGGSVALNLLTADTSYWAAYPILYATTKFDSYSSKNPSIVFIVEFSLNFLRLRDVHNHNAIYSPEEFESEDDLQKIYQLIDIIAKAVRLTPME